MSDESRVSLPFAPRLAYSQLATTWFPLRLSPHRKTVAGVTVSRSSCPGRATTTGLPFGERTGGRTADGSPHGGRVERQMAVARQNRQAPRCRAGAAWCDPLV